MSSQLITKVRSNEYITNVYMRGELRILNFLASKDAAVILVHGLDDDIYLTKLKNKQKVGPATFGRSIEILIEVGLLEAEKQEEKIFPFKALYKLTPKGREIAIQLKRVYEIMKEES